MLETVTAQRFDRQMTNGRTGPCLLACERVDGQEVEVVAKFSAGCDRGTGALVAESIGAMLAVDLDLPVPEPLAVVFDDDFVQILPAAARAVADRMQRSVRFAFGSAKLPPGFAVLPVGKSIPPTSRQQAAEIFAFDCLIQNADRRPENPNLQFNGHSFAIFDHELAFLTEGIIGWQPPWQPGALQGTRDRHTLFTALAGRQYDWARIEGAWQALSQERLAEFRAALPYEWTANNTVADEALVYLAQVRDNIRPALAEVARVLA